MSLQDRAAVSEPSHRTTEEFTAQSFVGTWKVVAGDIGHPSSDPVYHALIQRVGDTYSLSSLVNGDDQTFHQTLRYNETTRTLDDCGTKLHRSISFWEEKIDGKSRIFAMRMPRTGSTDPDALLPWECAADGSLTDRGTWGAEEG